MTTMQAPVTAAAPATAAIPTTATTSSTTPRATTTARGGLRLVEPTRTATVAPRRSTKAPARSGRRVDEDLTGGVKSVVAALDVLDCFVDEDELGVSDIARRLGVAKSTAHRLLTSLCARGLAERNPETGQYRLGLHLFELGQLTANRMRLRRAALPLLEELRQTSGCSTQLAIARGADVFFVVRLETLHGMRQLGAAPRRVPVHVTASGRAISAFDPSVARATLASGMPPLVPGRVTTPQGFERAIDEIRRRGVATTFDEVVEGQGSVAAPVLDASGRAVAAVSLIRPTDELRADLGRLSQVVLIAARRLSRTLGI